MNFTREMETMKNYQIEMIKLRVRVFVFKKFPRWGGWQGLDHMGNMWEELWIFHKGNLSFLPCVCMYVVLSRWTYGYLFYSMRYNPVLLYFVAKIWPLGALSVGS